MHKKRAYCVWRLRVWRLTPLTLTLIQASLASHTSHSLTLLPSYTRVWHLLVWSLKSHKPQLLKFQESSIHYCLNQF